MKGIILIAAVVLVWFVVRTVREGEMARLREVQRRQASARRDAPRRQVSATETVACPRCGAYVPADHRTACGREDCPFPSS